MKYLEEATTGQGESRTRASLSHKDAVIDLLQKTQGEQGRAGQPSAGPEADDHDQKAAR